MSSPKVTLLAGGKSAVITYIRLIQKVGKVSLAPPPPPARPHRRAGANAAAAAKGGNWWSGQPRGSAEEEEEEEEYAAAPQRPVVAAVGAPSVVAFEETRVWELQPAGNWLCMHFHRSEA
eukprot:1176015-Prorocentrum_minimum.AAC.1